MTSKLMDRLARLEGIQAVVSPTRPMPPELARACLQAIAIGLGGYPRSAQPVPPYPQDTISDGFARGLGYGDRDDMEAGIEADPIEWDRRITAAEEALVARYMTGSEGKALGPEGAFQFFVRVLDEIGAARTSNRPPESPQFDRRAKSIRRALALFGTTSENQIAEACGCR